MKLTNISFMLVVGLAANQVLAANKGSTILSDSPYDCLALEELFDCTECLNGYETSYGTYYPYDTTPNDDYYQDYELVTCSFPGLCPDGTVKNSCQWQRYLGFGCVALGPSAVAVVFGTNSLPDHCYYQETNPPYGSSFTYDAYAMAVMFNTKVTLMDSYDGGDNFHFTSLKSQTDIDAQLCDSSWARTQNIDSSLVLEEDYEETANLIGFQNSDSIVGIALNGVWLSTANTVNGYDAFFPKAFGGKTKPEAIEVDVCLGTS